MDLKKTTVNDLIAITYYGRITEVHSDGLTVEDCKTKKAFRIKGKEIVDDCMSASQFTKTEKVTKTAMAEKLVESWGKIFTVEFEKVDGTKRLLRGYLVSSENLLGRSSVIDLDVLSGHPLRLVDHRTISFLILDNVKYILKT